ncbi:sugar phosphate isomerase/epimerase family protein [Paludisphaera borealis]|uniref:Inosose isomerase n=1 Tax=Paludisphaera borealis TaxID=1387353 RepID=A0A1U7CSD8_9BACT|nr:TIM barrel protein [Paludisphaera borealis]APW61860.1 Inosose isomerase [Paludisphaera borealis]
MTTRRDFLRIAGAAGLASVAGVARGAAGGPAMTMDLVCGNLGVKADLPTAVALAHKHGFTSLAPDAGELGRLSDGQLGELLGDKKTKGLAWGAAALLVDFRGDDAAFRAGMADLPAFASALQRAGATRVGTWIRPGDERLTYVANFRQHARRLREVAAVLGGHGVRLGLEYVGPKTAWSSMRHPFIHTLAETRDLIAEIGRDDVGLVLDSWHWYTAGETADDLRGLTNRDVVACDLNDAPASVPVDQQRDGVRELPCATGVIDLRAFLKALAAMGYDGPARAEPFNATLRTLPADVAVATAARSMKQAFALIG